MRPGPGGAERYQAKICDFGISKRVTDLHNDVHHTRAVGTPVYMAPEVMAGARRAACYSLGSDVYSYGVVLWMLDKGYSPSITRPLLSSSQPSYSTGVSSRRGVDLS